MTPEELKRVFPNASESTLRRNFATTFAAHVLVDGSRETAELESDISNGALGKVQVQKGTSGRFLVRVTSFRRRLLDEDNLCEKYHCDLCRYSGIISGDSPATTQIEVCQQKVAKGKPEETKVEIWKIE